ncbi:MAG TPA: hypothetical protein VID26_08230 [Candidatus Limnocylindrales bacterium]
MKTLVAGLLCALLAACAAPPAPSASADSITDVQAALTASGIPVVATVQTTSTGGDDSCIPGLPVRTWALYEEAPGATFHPGEKPPVAVLVFATPEARQAYEARISSDGSEISGVNCTETIDYVSTPHWYGGGRYLLQVVSDDPAIAASVAAAAARLGSP